MIWLYCSVNNDEIAKSKKDTLVYHSRFRGNDNFFDSINNNQILNKIDAPQ